jgi:capsular polysaccharide biosynthesis protein
VIRRRILASRFLAVLLVAVFTVGGAVAGWAVEQAKGPQFQASTDVLVRFWSVESFMLSGQSTQVTSADVADAATLASSRDVLDRAAAELHDGQTGHDLAADVVVTPSATSNAVSITATATDAGTAKRTSAAVAAAMIAALKDRITASSQGLTGVDSDLSTQLQQRADVLNTSVRPLVALATSDAQQTAPTTKSLIAFAIVGLAAGTLLVVGVRFARPTIDEARVAQRLVGRPAVPFRLSSGSPETYRLVRRLLDDRTRGSILFVPVDGAAEKAAAAVADWARTRSADWDHTRGADDQEAGRIVSGAEPALTVLAPRPGTDQVAAVLLVVPRGTPRRAVSDAVTLLSSWRPADAVVVTT